MSTIYPTKKNENGEPISKKPVFIELMIVAIIFIYNFGYGLALGPVTWIYNADILPDTGVAISTTLTWIFDYVIGLFFPLVAR